MPDTQTTSTEVVNTVKSNSTSTPSTSQTVTTPTIKIPGVVVQREATALESVQSEIGFMVMHRMKRLLVICDMHGADLREILSATSQKKIDVHDGRAVMREAILTECNRLASEIQRRLDQTWPLTD